MNRPAVICNGLQKSGLHLIQNLVMVMGWERAPDKFDKPVTKTQWKTEPYGPAFCDLQPGTVAYTHLLPLTDFGPHTVFHIRRNPRNVLVSAARWQYRSLPTFKGECSSDLIDAVLTPSFIDRTWQFLDPPRGGQHSLFRFEDLVGENPDCDIRHIGQVLCPAVKLDIPVVARLMIGDTRTYNEKPSRWEEVWDTRVDSKWGDLGGIELEQAFGYRNNL